MTRMRGALLALVLVLAAGAGYATWALHHAKQQAADLGPGNQDPAHLAAARALVDRLTVPAGATRDPYSSACHAQSHYCITSTRLTPKQLMAQAIPLVKAAGATQLFRKCYSDGPPVECFAQFDLNGTHLGVEAGRGGMNFDASPTHVAVIVANDSAQAARRSAPLGDWATADPFPAGWVLFASCLKAEPDGCHSYESDRSNRPVVAGTVAALYAQAEATLSTAGFLLENVRCLPATGRRPAGCVISGFRFRTVGGFDGELLVLSLHALDPAHVQLIAHVSTV